jgi:helicase required for RNAi-mediated heterochromatin assembly 1
MRREPTLLPDLDGAVESKSQYLERQYKACRHEGIEHLRKAIYLYRQKNVESKHSNVYTKARVRGYTFSKQGAACKIAFSTEMSQFRPDWFDPDEARLKVGGLVALSPASDKFKNQCLVAVVAARPLYGGLVPDQLKGEGECTPPRIDIFWSRSDVDSDLSWWDPSEEMVMIEAKATYFEPVRHAMLGLQHAALRA